MIGKIAHTLVSKAGMMLLALVLLLVTTKLMGAQNKGEISLLVVNLTIIATVSGFFGGPALVYLAPRFKMATLLKVNYLWSVVASGLVLLCFGLGGFYSPLSWPLLYALGLTESLLSVHLNTMLGYEKVKAHNFILLLKTGLAVLVLLLLWRVNGTIDFSDFATAYSLGLAASLLASVAVLWNIKQEAAARVADFRKALRECMRYGTLVQTGNLAQLLNYRLSLYYLEWMLSPPEVALVRIGIYTAVLQIAEALLQFGKSVGMVQYARLSNMTDLPKALSISLYLAKLNAAITLLGMVAMLLLPAAWYALALGAEFAEVKPHLYLLLPGMFALAISNALSHYFSGIGRHRYNMWASLYGLVFTALAGWLAVFYFGTYGAAIVASGAYMLVTGYQVYTVKRKDGVRWADWRITSADLRLTVYGLQQLLSIAAGKDPGSSKAEAPRPE